jgi:hypothetical protein
MLVGIEERISCAERTFFLVLLRVAMVNTQRRAVVIEELGERDEEKRVKNDVVQR